MRATYVGEIIFERADVGKILCNEDQSVNKNNQLRIIYRWRALHIGVSNCLLDRKGQKTGPQVPGSVFTSILFFVQQKFNKAAKNCTNKGPVVTDTVRCALKP